MSIFSSKKSKVREVDVGKAKQQQALAGKGPRPQPNGGHSRNGTANAVPNAALSAGARTVQRAQIMAASRKRMNSETPDYSIEGAAKGPGAPRTASVPSNISLNAARQAAQGSKSSMTVEPKSRAVDNPQRLSKLQRPNNDEQKSRANIINIAPQNGAVTPIHAALQTSNSPQPSPKPNDVSNVGTPPNGFMIQKTPLLPMDSPTLGYDGSFTKPPPPSTSRSGSATPSFKTSTQIQGGISVPQDVRVGRLSRNDSGLSKSGSREDGSHESKASKTSSTADKSGSVPPGIRAEEKTSGRSSRSSTYVSRLDPGPTRSSFAEPVESSKIEDLFNGDDVQKRPRQTSRPQKFQGLDMDARKDASGSAVENSPPPVEPSAPKDAGVKGLSRIVAASQPPPVPQTGSSAPQSRKEERHFVQQPRSSTSQPAKSREIESEQESAAKPSTLPVSPLANTEGFRTAPTSTTNSPPIASDSQHRNTGSTDSKAKSPASDSYFSNPAAAAPAVQSFVPVSRFASQPDPRSSSSSERRSTLHPVSVLEGFKVNKTGHVLDEEGEVIGELFEGDLIDCVRQKIDGNGDVLDESGEPVGRVRTVVEGSIAAPRWSISSGTSLPLGTYSWGRRASTASQQTHNTHQTQQNHPTFFNRPSVSHVVAPPVEGNTFVAELDASNEAEASPVVDQSEIFSPFAAPSRPDSSTSTTNRSELAAEEKSDSQSSRVESRRASVTTEERPIPPKPVRKWTSRYFESSPIEGQLARRNSATPDMVQSPVDERLGSPKTTSVMYGAVSRKTSRAVIGPTLESLMEQEPSLFSNQPDLRSFGGSTPNLPLSGSKSGSSSPTPRPSSTQYGPPAPGLASRLSSHNIHQPMRRSPLGNYETTPPGSGGGNAEDDKTRSRSVPAAARANSKKASKLSMEAEDAAPAPEISKKKWQEKRALLAVPSSVKTGAKRKSRFSFMMGRNE